MLFFLILAGDFSVEKELEDGSRAFVNSYGLKAFLPIARGYSFSHYDDLVILVLMVLRGLNFGNDLMGSVGTPIAVESGVVEHL